jgi:anti-sigma factor RsiW
MKVTRQVVFDLLPSYFAGEVSDDTRALVDEFLATDPEFARVTERFRRLYDERHAEPASAGAREREAFTRAREITERRGTYRALTIAYILALLFVLLQPWVSGRPMSIGLWIMAIAFAATSLVSGVYWYRIGRAI